MQSPSQFQSVRRVLGLLFAHRRRTLVLTLLVLSAAALELTVPMLTQRLVDQVVALLRQPQGQPTSLLLLFGLGILAATVGARGLRSVYNYHLFKTVTQIEDDARNRAFANYLRMDTQYHRTANSGQVVGCIDRGGSAVYTILLDILGQSLVPPLAICTGVLVALASHNHWIALAVFLPLPVYVFVISRLTGRIQGVERGINDGFEAMHRESYDIASNVATVKKFSQERPEAHRQRGLLRQVRSAQYRGERLWALIENSQTLIAALGRVVVITLGGWLVLSGQCTIGEFVLFVALQDMVYGPISQLSVILPRLQRNVTRAERLFELTDAQPVVADKPGAAALPALQDAIEFRDVWFRYGDSGRWALRGVNLTVPAGSTVALIGRSGSGKSTFINLLMRMYDPQRGSIRIDGMDLRDVTQQSLHDQMAVVPQEVDLFSRTIRENIGYGQSSPGTADVEGAARLALAHEFILRTGQGYETTVGERGLLLSGGERQRIGIARAILRDPRILILDEATSHLDTESELAIQRATECVVAGRTSFLIAHRLSTVMHADLVVVFDHGTIEAVGTHEELWDTSPTYRTLYELHLGDAERRPEVMAMAG